MCTVSDSLHFQQVIQGRSFLFGKYIYALIFSKPRTNNITFANKNNPICLIFLHKWVKWKFHIMDNE